MSVSRSRHIAKAITWRLAASLETLLLGWLITGSFKIGMSISMIELFSKTLLYYVHERIWYRFKFGIEESDNGENEVRSN